MLSTRGATVTARTTSPAAALASGGTAASMELRGTNAADDARRLMKTTIDTRRYIVAERPEHGHTNGFETVGERVRVHLIVDWMRGLPWAMCCGSLGNASSNMYESQPYIVSFSRAPARVLSCRWQWCDV